MTDVMERPATGRVRNREGRWVPARRPQTNPDCKSVKYHGSADAYRNHKCRCPEAIEAFQAQPKRKRGQSNVQMPAAVDADGNCIAGKHDSYMAWLAGCRCPEAQRRRQVVFAAHQARDAAIRKPWKKWRGPDKLVSRNNLLLLLAGFADSPTYAERMVATLILSQRGTIAGPLGTQQIADRLGISCAMVLAYQEKPAKLAEERAQRRLADVKWKAVRVAKARDRKAQRG